MAITTADITGLVLAGGRGTRMGDVDKGLQTYRGSLLIEHALRRLAPQVGPMLISANRNRDAYARYGHPVLADRTTDFRGPLAGIEAGLLACGTRWLAVMPCDSPHLPPDLVARLAAAFDDDVGLEVATARAGDRVHPVCCVMSTAVAPALTEALAHGERAVGRWIASRRHRDVSFDDASLFRNLNHPADLLDPG